MIAAMNKSDIAPAENFGKVEAINKHCVPTMAETELALKKAAAAGLVDLAYRVHSDLGDKFIRAVNAKTKRTVGADYELQDGDVIRIVANK